ncbi:uncharacterized protein [Dermacentor albipictus]|uniref:uncharacterized protein isoform X7 n=1 Tax=Dermacentor albipictus TaxID=60249 RepID=UPI0038FCA6C0
MLIEFFLIAQFLLLGLTCRPPVILELGSVERGSAYVRHQLWRMTESSPGNAGNAPARTSDPARNIKARHNCSLLGMTPLRQWDAHRFVVTGFHQVSRQDGLTPCHLMLSLSDRFQDMGPLFKAKRREHGVQDMVHTTHNGLT